MKIAAAVQRLAGVRIAVIGDVMLDHYVSGQVTRVSEEAPVPILRVRNDRYVAGGGANVAHNAAALGAEVRLIGLVGTDVAGERLRRLLADEAPRVALQLVDDPSRATTIKTRYMGGQHQMLRVDREDAHACTPDIVDTLLAELDTALSNVGALVVSDYGKGVLTDAVLAGVFARAAKAGVPVIVDPKRNDFAAYRGASVITPNRKELTLATGLPCETDAEASAAAARAQHASGAAILLTRSERGMSYFATDAAPIHRSAQARAVFDVSGAGDTVVAAFAAATAARMSVEDAMTIANAAAGVVVGKPGAATVTPDELVAAFSASSAVIQGASGEGASREDAARQCAIWRAQGLQVGFANGCFDLIHPGHVSLIQQAAAACDRLVVALNTDASVQRLKGPSRPLQDEHARVQVMAALRGVALVTLFDEDTPLALIEALQPDVIFKGADYREDEVVGGAEVKARGGRVVLIPLIDGQSTTNLAKKAGAPKS